MLSYMYSRGQNKVYVSFAFCPVKQSSNKMVTPNIACARKLQENSPVEKNKVNNDINTAILSTRQQCKLHFNKFNEVQRITC